MRLPINNKPSGSTQNNTNSLSTKWSPEIAKCGFTQIPNILLIGYKELGLTSPEFVTLAAILTFKWDERRPTPGVKAISNLSDKSPRTTRKHIASLEKKGLLERVGRDYQTNEYDFTKLTNRLNKLAKANLPHCQNVPEGTATNSLPPRSLVTTKEDSYKEDAINKTNPVSADTTESSKQIQLVYDYFIKQFDSNSNQFRLTPKRKTKIKARLKDCGYDMIAKAIDCVAANSFYRGDNERGWKADLDFIIRSYEQVEKFSQLEAKELSFKADW